MLFGARLRLQNVAKSVMSFHFLSFPFVSFHFPAFPFLSFPSFPFVSFKSFKNHPKFHQKSIKNRPKWSQKPLKINQNGSQNRSERQGRFWMPKMVPKWIRNGAIGPEMEPKWSQKASKIDIKSLQKSMQKPIPSDATQNLLKTQKISPGSPK